MVTCFCCGPVRMGRRGLLAGLGASLVAAPAFSQQGPVSSAPSAAPPPPALVAELVAGNRILANEGVVDGFGHISVRHPDNPQRFLMARSMAPALVTAADIMEFDLDGNATEPATPARNPYLERFIHGGIYRVRPDVKSVVHSHSPGVIPFANVATPLRPMNHISAFLGVGVPPGGGVPVFEIRTVAGMSSDMLIRSDALGKALATRLGEAQVVLMRGHGSTVVGASIRHAVYRAIYTEVNAKMQAEAMQLGTPAYLNAGEAKAAMETNDRLVDRPWGLWMRRIEGK
jgi:ribulose-5-phosphate 4-epimerase/fuculose-1-phosphate aldolase